MSAMPYPLQPLGAAQEMEEEGIVNRLQRQIEMLLAKYKASGPHLTRLVHLSASATLALHGARCATGAINTNFGTQALEARVEARGVSLKDVAAIDTTTEWVYGRSPTKTQADTRAASGALPDQRGAHCAAGYLLIVRQCAHCKLC